MGYWDKREEQEQQEKLKGEDTTLEQLEQDCLEELDEVAQGFRDRMKAEKKRFRDMCDTEYWFCVCFTSREQKEELMTALGLDAAEKYIDGKELARAFKREIQTPDLRFSATRVDKSYSELAR